MTINTTYSPIQYNGNGVTTLFPFPYTFFDDTDLVVTLTNISTGVNTTSLYTVSGGNGDVGSVTFDTAPPSGYRVTIECSIPYTQSDDYVENQAFPADTLENGLDRAAIRDQQLANSIDRSLKFDATLSGSLIGILPQPESGKILVWDGSTGRVGNADVADLSSTINTVITSIAIGDFLVWDGTNWINVHKSALPIDAAQATSSAGLALKNNTGTSVLTIGAGGGTGATFAGGVTATGNVQVSGTSLSPAYITMAEGTDNGTNKATLIAPSSIASDYTLTLPSSSGTLALNLAGEVRVFAFSSPPTGWLECDGAEISRTTYAALYAAIGTTWGAGDGTTTFNIPDFRGEFLRGWDHGRGVDAARTFASYQDDAMQGHIHGITTYQSSGGSSRVGTGSTTLEGSGVTTGSPQTDGANGTPRTAAETRPRNKAILYCIKI